MSPLEWAGLFRDYGPWGLLALSLWALRWMFLRYDAVQEKRIDESKETTKATLAAAEAVEKTNELLTTQGARLDRFGEILGRQA